MFRLLSCIYALGFQIAVNGDLERPAVGWLLFAVLIAWSAACAVAYLQGFGRRLAWVLAEIAIVVALMLSTEFVASEQWALNNQSWPTTLWATNATISAAILLGPIYGMLSGVVVVAASTVAKGVLNYDLGRNATVVIELAVGLGVGMAAQTARSAHADLERAARLAATIEERDGCLARCTTGPFRCSHWFPAVGARSAVRQPNWLSWPANRSVPCAGSSARRTQSRGWGSWPMSVRCCGGAHRTGWR